MSTLPALASDQPENWDADTFIAMVATIRYHTEDQTRNFCRFIFLPNKCEVFIHATGPGALVYEGVALDIIKTRYTQAMSSIEELINKEFTIIRLELVSQKGTSGAKLTLLTPGNRQHTFVYFHNGNTPESLIPDDFLYDLKMFPSRYG